MKSWARFWLPEDKTGYSWISYSCIETNWVRKTHDKKLVQLRKRLTSNNSKRNERPTKRPSHTDKLGQKIKMWNLPLLRLIPVFCTFLIFSKLETLVSTIGAPRGPFFQKKSFLSTIGAVNNWYRGVYSVYLRQADNKMTEKVRQNN